MQRKIRRQIDYVLTGVGIVIIFGAVLIGSSLSVKVQLPIALVGVLLLEAGVWGLSSVLIPSERRNSKLRLEGNRMMDLIRELDSAAYAKKTGQEDATRFQNTLDEMHSTVSRMSELAGQNEEEHAPAPTAEPHTSS